MISVERVVPGRLAGQTIVVTGAASGIGLAVAEQCIAEGAGIIGVDRDGAGLARLQEKTEGRALTFEADVSDEHRAMAIVAELEAQNVSVTGLVASAGIIGASTFVDASVDHWRHVIEINLMGTIIWARACATPMIQVGRGSIVVIASQLLHGGGKENICYVTSKGAVRAFGRSLARELGPSGVRVNVLSPGPIDTPMLRNRWNADELDAAYERISSRPVLGRVGQAQEIASAACFLLSKDASYVTGAELLADGGYSVG